MCVFIVGVTYHVHQLDVSFVSFRFSLVKNLQRHLGILYCPNTIFITLKCKLSNLEFVGMVRGSVATPCHVPLCTLLPFFLKYTELEFDVSVTFDRGS